MTQTDSTEPQSFLRIVVVEGSKVAFMEKGVGLIPASDWDDDILRPRCTLLPTAVPEIAFVVKHKEAHIGGSIYFEVVDAKRDLTMPLENAISLLKELGWVKASMDHSFGMLWQAYLAYINF